MDGYCCDSSEEVHRCINAACGAPAPSLAGEKHHRDREARGVFSTWDLFTNMAGYRSASLPRLHRACVPSRCYKFSLSSWSAKVDWLFV
ncbi:hypothetical protein GUJ93_ZPchr0008g11715 [Zizania palustris]|uniref:Uncharacterized protein n=1 Tax=Zizania palustris TaxID=103762 RepID=A0A8J5RXL3_ZIZPA|nr:hypothetical protein GUJ93_ZPchr0008g12506 [Zizania palustris]KAG8047874.1 hypothetical protein GUJ93_ZPchr0008g13971 [Zizania palustris]KAG8047877.1 hypothetical protein GUJ93_ZPchr0008g11715 [Zizania palustris]